MLLTLPLAAFVSIFLISREKGYDWRRALLIAAIFCATCVALITEILSVPRLINPLAVAVTWLAVAVAGFGYLLVLKRISRRASGVDTSSSERLDRASVWLLAATGVLTAIVVVLAIVAPPSTWDAMEYHLPRVTMWMNNHTVRFFMTPDYAQLIYGPLADYAMMHTHLLWGSDRFVNLVEALSLIGTAIAVSLIAGKLGAGVRGQALAAVICATIPQGILEASGAMNTYAITFWIAITVAFLMDWNDHPSGFNTLCVGAAAGLAVLTKGTAYIVLPSLVVACWWMGSASTRLLFLKRGLAMAAIIVALNLPHYIRCYEFTGSPLGVPLPVKYPRVQLTVTHVTARRTLSNVLRNLSLHLGTPIESINARTERIVRLAIRGIGDNPDDPEAIWQGEAFQMNHFSLDEVRAGNPVHLVLAFLSIGLVLGSWKQKPLPRVFWYSLGIIGSFIFVCALISWTIWSTRYHLPVFALSSAVSGFTLERYFSRRIRPRSRCPGHRLCLAQRSLEPYAFSDPVEPRVRCLSSAVGPVFQ